MKTKALESIVIGFGVAGWLREPVFYLNGIQRMFMALLIAWVTYILITTLKSPRRI